MTKHISITAYDLHPNGLSITYTADGETKTLAAQELGACYLLQQVGYIRRHRYKKGVLMVLLDVTEDMVTPAGLETRSAGKIEVTWDYFTRNYDLDEVWANEIIQYHEMHDKIFKGCNTPI